ncbi:hypothetical protein [Exiguobacterium aurantiacum]|nr:hypothetical protein [Exiguobacterium aurantiacum]
MKRITVKVNRTNLRRNIRAVEKEINREIKKAKKKSSEFGRTRLTSYKKT